MKKLRWAMEGGGFWEQDMSTPVTLDGVARPVQGDTIPLGIGRGARLSRHEQVDFFQRFMAMPFVPSFSQHHRGFSVQRLLSLPFPFSQRWFPAVLGQLNVQELLKSFRKNPSCFSSSKALSSWLQTLRTTLSDKSLYAFNFCSELLLSPDDVLLLSFEAYGDHKLPRTKALLHHKFPHHNLTVEASRPGLFVDQHGCYWDVPFTLDVDLSSVSCQSGTSYHFCLHHSAGSPAQQLEGQPTSGVPPALLTGVCAKCAVSFKKNIDIWRSDAPKLKMVQPYDIFLSNPHISASGIIGAVVTASVGHNSIRLQGQNETPSWKGLSFRTRGVNSAVLTDLFASVSLSAQHGNFQRPFLDLTRFYAQLDFPSGSKFLSAASRVAYDLYNGQVPRMEAVQSICPDATISFQQQIAGPFSFRIDSGVTLDLKKREWFLSMNNPVFAIEYALQVLGSAKAVAWYTPKQKEFMIELRFFET